jgi:ribosomal protein L29
MKNKDQKELKTKSTAELKSMLQAGKKDLFTLTMDLSRNKLKNTSALGTKRRDIAQILTALKEQQSLQLTKGGEVNSK